MKYAVIDMGSNSVRLMIAEVQNKKLSQVEKHLAMTRLGAGVNETGKLSEASMQATIEALAQFSQVAKEKGAQMLGAFATSAVRDASNGEAFAELAKAQTGVDVFIISGTFEAELGYKGVLSGVSEGLRQEKFLIVDIGGGSTELIIADKESIHYRHSFNVGTVRMTGKHITTDPISREEDRALHEDVAQILSAGIEAIQRHNPSYVIGIGGTATTFGAMMLKMETYDRDRVHNAWVSEGTLRALVDVLGKATVSEKCLMAGLMPKRADVIYAGGVIMEFLLQQGKLKGFYVSDFDNLEGILVEKNIIE